MGGGHGAEYARLGAVVLARVKETGAPKALKSFIAAFGRAHKSLQAAETATQNAQTARGAALDKLGAADTALDRTLDLLANRLIGAGLAPRQNAFRGFSKYAPGALKELAYATEVREVQKLVAAVGRAKPPAAVAKAASACGAAAASASRALGALSKAQGEYASRLAARDALLPDWKRAYERLRVNAKAAWIDTPAIYKAVFAPPDAVAGTNKPRRSRPRRKPKGASAAKPVAVGGK